MSGAATPETTVVQASQDRPSRRSHESEQVDLVVPTTTRPSSRSRLTLEFSSDATERLRDIKEKMNSPSHADVIRKALLLLDWVLQLQEENKQLQVKDLNEGTTEQVKLIL